MNATGFLPHSLIAPFLLYGFIQHELAEWGLLRTNGMVGSSVYAGLLVDFAAGIGGFLGWIMLAAYGYDFGWKPAIGMGIIGFITAPLHMITSSISSDARFMFWMILVPTYYVLMVFMLTRFSWFGLF